MCRVHWTRQKALNEQAITEVRLAAEAGHRIGVPKEPSKVIASFDLPGSIDISGESGFNDDLLESFETEDQEKGVSAEPMHSEHVNKVSKLN